MADQRGERLDSNEKIDEKEGENITEGEVGVASSPSIGDMRHLRQAAEEGASTLWAANLVCGNHRGRAGFPHLIILLQKTLIV